MKTTKLFGLLVMSFLVSSCFAVAKDAKGKEITKQIPAKNFSAIELKGAADIVYTQERNGRITVTAPEDVIGLIDVSVRNNTLSVSTQRMDEARRNRNFNITVKASSPMLSNIDVRGAGDITLQGTMNLNELGVKVKGAGDLKAEDLHCRNLSLDISGAGDVNLQGEAQKAVYMVKGAGDIDAFNFRVHSLVVDVSGAGDVECNASELSIENKGAGNVTYKGNPVIKQINSQGIGTIKSSK